MELTGETKKLDAFIELMKEYGILELGRTGVVSLKRGGRMSGRNKQQESEEAESKKKKNRRIREGRSATDRFFVCGGRKKTDIAEEKGASPTAFDRICKEEMVSL